MELTQVYDRKFYGDQVMARTSAKQIISLLRGWYKPSSVVDVGCGLGTWLSVWRELDPGVVVAGLDGNDVGASERYISVGEYGQVDLTQDFSKSLQVAHEILAHSVETGGGGNSLAPKNLPKSKDLATLSKPFELAQSLEVAEHLYPEFAPNFVKLLTSLSNVVLFSAAIPYQGGVHHVNEQSPGYWADLFAKEGYVCIDCLREKIWEDESILWWYRQNIMIFVHESKADLFGFAPVVSPMYAAHFYIWEEKSKWIEAFLHAHEDKPIRTAMKLLLKGMLMQLHLWGLAQRLRQNLRKR